MTDLDARLREALRELAPAYPATEGLAADARRYAARARRARHLAVAGATAAVIAVAALAVGSFDRPDRVVPADPLLTPADCTRQAASTTIPRADGEPMAGFGASWVCPDLPTPEAGDTADGWRLPTAMLTAMRAPGLSIFGRDDDSGCGSIRPGPAFTLTLEATDGQLTTYRSRELYCGGAYTLASFLEALAADEADARAASAPDEELACRSQESWSATREGASLDSPLVTATFCLVPRFAAGDPNRPIQPMVARSYLPIRLSADVLAMLNADLTSARSGFRGNGACNGEGAWSYTVMGQTKEGEDRMLATACLDEFFVHGAPHFGFIPSTDTSAALRALVPPS